FFFQAEDGIRDATVTGVQTCALPISVFLEDRVSGGGDEAMTIHAQTGRRDAGVPALVCSEMAVQAGDFQSPGVEPVRKINGLNRSEERRVGKDSNARVSGLEWKS